MNHVLSVQRSARETLKEILIVAGEAYIFIYCTANAEQILPVTPLTDSKLWAVGVVLLSST